MPESAHLCWVHIRLEPASFCQLFNTEQFKCSDAFIKMSDQSILAIKSQNDLRIASCVDVSRIVG